jgi:uncharacterized protein (DUF924 family)
MDWREVIDFWFGELGPQDWFRKDNAIDTRIVERFASVHSAAAAGELWFWRCTALGALAEIIVLDQFSRNMFRNDRRAFASDGMALVLAQEALRRSFDGELSPPQKSFMYMPFMHSESTVIHETALKLFSQPGLEENLDFERGHKAIIERFGRFPHRNEILGRPSTPEELEFLKTSPGF